MSLPTSEQGAGQQPPLARDSTEESASTVRHEEELEVRTTAVERGAIRARKHVESRHVEETVPRMTERLRDVERVAPNEQDSGEIETLPDGSVSIPVLEEELVVTKRTVVRERIIVRKEVETEQRKVEAELRREHVDVEVDDGGGVGEQGSERSERSRPRATTNRGGG